MNHWLTYFAHAEVLWLIPVLGLAWLSAMWGRRQKRRQVHLLGRAGAVQKMLLVDPDARKWRSRCLFLSLPLLLIGSAGPRWGRDSSQEAVQEHDVVVVLDVSQSMLAEQPSRQERALRLLRDLADHLQKRGGERLALVVFAARPHLVFPLTRDYDHFRQALAGIEAGDLPADIRPAADDARQSGTSIGAALRLAVKAFDLETPSPRAVLLLSDGDDPARDEEWLQGVHEARAAHIPVHTVGIGDPLQESTILLDGDFLRDDGKIVHTRLEEPILIDIARRTGGVYVPVHTSNLALGSVLPEILKNQPPETAGPTLAAIPVMKPRHAWFLWPALVLLAVSLLLRDARMVNRGTATASASEPSLPLRVGVALLVMFALFQMGAAMSDDDWIRQGNAAFKVDDLDAALALYEKAEPLTTDPGLVAFNKAAVLYRLKRFREAELHYLRCLEDDQAPGLRQTQALFGLGIALLRQAKEKDVAILDRAIDAFTACAQKSASPELTTDAQFNLELARWLRLKAGPVSTQSGNEQQPMPNGQKKEPKKQPGRSKEEQPMKSGDPPDPKSNPEKGDPSKASKDPAGAQELTKKLASAGPLHSIPDNETLKPLPPEDTAAYLEQLAERILQDRRGFQRRSAPVLPQVKDW